MKEFSGKMKKEFVEVAMAIKKLLWQVPLLQNGKRKPLKSNFKTLKLKSDSLFDKRDAISKKLVRELRDGKIPTRECHRWLKKVLEIEQEVYDILKFEKRSSQLDVPKHMQLRHRLLILLNEIAEYLEKSPQKNGTVADAAHGRSKRIKGFRIGSNAYQTFETGKRQKIQRKAEISNIATETVPLNEEKVFRKRIVRQTKDVEMIAEPSIPILETISMRKNKGHEEYAEADGEVLLEKEVHKGSAVHLTDRKARKAVGTETTKETTLTSLGESPMESTIERSNENEHKAKQMAVTLENAETPPMSEEIIDIVSHEIKEVSPPKETRKSEIESSILESGSSISEAEGSTLVSRSSSLNSGNEKACQMKPKSNKNFKRLIQFNKALEFSRSRLRNKDAPELLPSQKKKDRSLSIGIPEKKICQKTEIELREFEKNTKATIRSTVQKVVEFITDDKARRIGIYGKGGIGKTTVLKTLVNCPEIQYKFDLVVQVTVSRHWSRKKIQHEILRQIGLGAEEPLSDVDIANKIFHALQSRKYLLLLDDIWEWIDLEAVGIPRPGPENHSGIIVATRSADICGAMAPDGQIEVKGLSWEEAWNLFQEQVGKVIDSPDIRPRAEAIVSECGGLPLLIIVIGKAMAKENDVLVWRLVLSKLLSVSDLKSADTKDETESVLQQLKVGYDRLQTYDLKSCFLYCALFPEDHKIRIAELINYWIQEGIISGNSASALRKGHRIVRHLAEASLVELVDGGSLIKMHDIIRDLASWIMISEVNCCQFLTGRKFSSMEKPDQTLEQRLLPVAERSTASSSKVQDISRASSLNHLLLSRAGAGLTEPPEEKEWEEHEMIFLMDNNFSLLPERPECPKLMALFLQRNMRLTTIPATFFNSMPCLQVLNLSKTNIRSLPPSVFRLTRLQALILRHCDCLSEISPDLGNLKLIEILDLHGTEIYSLPQTIGELSLLKHLHVSFYGFIDDTKSHKLQKSLIPRAVLIKLQALEELSIVVQPGDPRWDTDAEFVTRELCTLKKLNAVNICFPKAKYLSHFINFSPVWKVDSLGQFKFVIGHTIRSLFSRVTKNLEFDFDQEDRCLRCVNANGGQVLDEVKKVLSCATAFYLDHQSSTSSLSEFGIANIRQLKFCILRECQDLFTIVDGSGITESALPNLVRLSLHYLWNLKSIWEGLLPDGSFNLLKTLSVHTCPRLEFVLSQPMLPYLPNLEDLKVEDCASLTEIIKSQMMIEVGVIELPKLQRLELQHLPQLVRICNGSYQNIEQINIENCPKLLKNMTGSELNVKLHEIE